MQTRQILLETVKAMCRRAKFMQLVLSWILQTVRQFMGAFLENVVLLRNRGVLQR